MNSFPVQQQYPQPQQQQQQQQASSIDPSLLAFRNQTQPGGNAGGNANGNKFPYGGGMGGGGFNPQLMSSQGAGGGGTLNPAHLMNGANHHQQQQQHQTVNPQQMFQQQHQQPQQQQQQQHQHGLMNGGMSINPAALNSSHLPNAQHPLASLSREQMQQFNAMPPQQQQMVQAKMAAVNAQAALNQQQQQQHHAQQQQQFQQQSLSHVGLQQQQQNSAAQQEALQQILAQQQRQQQQATYYGDRPSSSASSHPQMMPPPAGMSARPPTAGPGPSSRPGTSHSHSNAPQVGLPGAQMQMQRPPSRPTTAGGFDGQQLQQHQFPMANGYSNTNQPKPANLQQPHFNQAASNMQQQQQQQYQQQQQHHQPQHSPPPGSPYRGAKRKVANGMDSPRMGNPGMMGPQMGGGMNIGSGMMGPSMGPPGMSRQVSNSSLDQQQAQPQNIQQNHPAMMNGYPPQSQSQQHPSQTLSNSGMRPQSSNGHIPPSPHTPTHNGGMAAMMNDSSRMGTIGNLSGGMNIGSIGPNMGMNMGMGNGDAPPRTPQRSTAGSQIPGYPAVGSTMPNQQHRQPPSPAFPQMPAGLQQSIMPSHGIKPSLDPAGSMGLKMGGLPPLGAGNFAGLDSRSAGLPSRIPSVAPPQPLNSSLSAVKQPPSAPGIQPVLQPLPANVQLNSQVTRVTVVPLAGSDVTIRPLSPSEIKDIQAWREVDKDYEGIWRKMKERMAEEFRTVTGPSKAAWWEKDAVDLTRRRPREQFDVRYPRQKKDRDGRERRKTGRREGLKLPRKLDAADANRPEQLVPIRLEFDVEHHKMRDSFVWNLNDPVVTPEAFAQSVVEDYALAPSYHAVITKSIQDQLSDFRIHSTNPDGDIEEADVDIVRGELDEEDAAWWESWRKRLRTERGSLKSARRAAGKGRKRRRVVKDETSVAELPAAGLDANMPADVDDIEVDETTMHEDMRILIKWKLDIIVGSMKLEDQFEWDLDNVNASPEQFAEVYGADLGLTGEYKTAIAHSIREQVQMYQKSLFLVGRPSDGSPIQDEDLRLSFLPSLSSGARSIDQVGSFTPLLNYLSDGDIERNEKEREKELNKRRKRNTRGRRGIAMPDREPIRTHRTPAIGFPELDPSTLAAVAAASAPTSRRAAAAAASLTIANMVASENGTLHMPQSTPLAPQPTPSTSKEKKPKGLFKAPSYPSSVLRPRARVTAPTASTAAESSSLSLPVDPDAPASTRGATADSRASRVITAKRAKELEREAKEKEYADGQHANMIDGVWHCSNCGCPEDIAVGRRKGPLGDKSQCGTCGKYWHRHRRPMAVEYNSSAEFHTNKIREAELARTMARKKGGAAALRAQNAGAATPGDDGEAASSPQNEVESEPPPRQSQQPTILPSEDDRAASPASSTSSDSEPPLAQRVSKVNGSNHASSIPPVPTSSGPAATQASPPTSQSVPTAVGASAPPAAVTPTDPPKWLWSATQSMRAKYPDDLFVLKRTNGTDWRIKCSDCPGKLYTPGPGETLSNYEVHLRNRLHRQKVNDRVSGGSQPS